MATGKTPAKFTDSDLRGIEASLPEGIDQKRLELLPKILREWSRIELQQHFSTEPIALIRDRRKQLEKGGAVRQRAIEGA